MKLIIFALTVLFTLNLQARNLGTAAKLSDFDQFISSVEAGYGPFYYKMENGIYEYDRMVTDFRERVKATKNNAEFYYLMLELIAAFKDGHFNGYVTSDYKKSVPLGTDLIAGKALITQIDRNKLDKKAFPFEIGDEIVAVDGVSIDQALDDLAKHVGSGYDKTVRRLASWRIVNRRAERMPVDNNKELKLSIRRGTSEIIEDVTLNWEISGTPIDEVTLLEETSEDILMRQLGLSNFNNILFSTNYDEISNFALLEEMNPTQLDSTFMCSGKTRIAIPKDATIILETPVTAYYYPSEKGNIGYLRIPHYAPTGPNGERTAKVYEEEYAKYEYAISELEKNTVALVIDQDHNCGGSVAYLEKLVGLFMNEAYKPMQFELLANREELSDFRSYVEQSKNTLINANLKKIYDLIYDTWLNSSNFLTTKTDITGAGEYLQPNFVTYTKPILMLIDELSGSGGDAFPSLLKGYGRATLLGTRTSGLGGHVEHQPPLNFSRLKYRMTKSLFYRPDGIAVENNGAVPDIRYDITREDVMYEFKGYRAFYTEKVLGLLD